MNYFALTALANFLTSALVGSFVLTRNPHSSKNRGLFYYSVGVGFWSLAYFFWQISKTESSAIFWCKTLMFFAIFIPSTMLHLGVALINGFDKFKKRIYISYFISIIFAILDVFTSFIVKDVRHRAVFAFWPSAGVLYLPFLVFFFGAVTYAHILMYKQYVKLTGLESNRIKYVFLGTIIAFSGGSTNYFLWFDINILPYGNILVSAYVFLVAFSIIKYRLMDIRLALTNTTIFICVYALVLGVPFYVYRQGNHLFALISMAILATVGPSIYIYLQRRSEIRILQEDERIKNVLMAMSIGLNAVKDLWKVLETIIKVMTKNLKVNHASIYLFDSVEDRYTLRIAESQEIKEVFFDNDCPLLARLKEKNYPMLYEEMAHVSENKNVVINGVERIVSKMQELSAAVIIPLVRDNCLMGFIALGERDEKRLYSKSLTDTLAIVASHVSLAIENAVYYEAQKIQIEEDSKRARIESLDMLANTMAHEIDNPMNIVINNANEISEIIKGVIQKTYFDAIFGKDCGDVIINELIKNDVIEEVSEEGTSLVKFKITEVSGHGTKILYDLIRNEVVEDINPTDVQIKPNLDQKESFVREIAKEDFDKVWKLLKARTEVRVKPHLDEKKEIVYKITQGSFDTVWQKLKECQRAVEGVVPDIREKLQRQCNEITNSSYRVSAIVNSVETSGKQDKAPMGEVYINAMMISMDALLALYKKKYNKVELIKEIEDDLPPIWGQTILIDEIMQNFIKNGLMAASEKNPERGGKVTLKIYRKQENLTADNIVIEVSDNGVGMMEKIVKQVFYVPASNRGSAQGQGVGLVRVRKIVVDLLKGTVKAESEGPGKGSRFIITLPVYKGGNSMSPKQSKRMF